MDFRLKSSGYIRIEFMSKIELINASCADQEVDVVVNAANSGLWAGGENLKNAGATLFCDHSKMSAFGIK